MSSCRIGIDIGGTFTDVVLFDEEKGEYHIAKVSSTPRDPSIGALEGVSKALNKAGFNSADVAYFSHGTTVATNAILEGKLAPTALVTTRGFRDVLEIARQRRPRQYDFTAQKSPVLVPRALRFEVDERIDARGQAIKELDADSVKEVAARLREIGIPSVAVCLLFSFMNPSHEEKVRGILEEELPGVSIFTSSEVLREYREYERTSTVCLSASVAPVVGKYVNNLEDKLRGTGMGGALHLMKSTGGIMSFRAVERRAVETVLSGPAAGAIGVGYIGSIAGYSRIIGIDMGGTSTDVCMVVNGKPRITTEGKVGEYPIKVPMIDIKTIGAGGGSIAWMDLGGALRVGPRSAGADPGPVCYSRGGTDPTVTDANVCLGRLNPQFFLGGEMGLDAEAAGEAIMSRVGKAIGRDLAGAAHGIVEIVNSNMGRAIREVSVASGYDPREFALMAFGGAGPLHAGSLADELDIPLVIVPPGAGILSAKGLLVADIRNDYCVTSISKLADTDPAGVESNFAQLEQQALNDFKNEGIDAAGTCYFVRSLDMRYLGQTYEINVPAIGSSMGPDALRECGESFHRAHQQLYWWSDAKRPVELVNMRVTAVIDVPKVPPARKDFVSVDPGKALKGRREVYFKGTGGFVKVPLYDRVKLEVGNEVMGPAIIESFESTTVVNPGHRAVVDEFDNVIIHTRGA